MADDLIQHKDGSVSIHLRDMSDTLLFYRDNEGEVRPVRITMTGWSGIFSGNKDVPFNKKNILELFKIAPWLPLSIYTAFGGNVNDLRR